MPELWPHQERAVKETLALISQGVRRVLITSPTGGGKTRLGSELAWHHLSRDEGVVWLTNRRLLVEQTVKAMSACGHAVGVRASGWCGDQGRLFQVSSVQTEHARRGRPGWCPHPAALVLVDEAHLQKCRMASLVMADYLGRGACVVGLTATPLGLAGLYDRLVVAGTVSELRAAGALVRCDHYAPDEPDLRHVGRVTLGEDLTERQVRSAMGSVDEPGRKKLHRLFGSVIDNWRRLNPERRPTILFAPGVAESLWFAEQFRAAGVEACHVDGEEVYLGGKTYKTSRQAREDALGASRDGRCPVLCNRFVLREGVDAPWLECGVLATVFGSVSSYVQSGGRLLRAHPGVESVTLLDHGGNWHRHGSLNADREWRLGLTDHLVSAVREDGFRKPPGDPDKLIEPVRCPRCSRVLARPSCPCGWELRGGRKSRPVVQADGRLVEVTGDIYRPRRISRAPDGPKLWAVMVRRSSTEKGDRTFRAAAALFAHENGSWPDPTWPLMPKNPDDFYCRVKDVPRERLR